MSTRDNFESYLSAIQHEIMNTEQAEPLQFCPPLFDLDLQVMNFHVVITTPLERNLAVLGDINGGKENFKRWLVAEAYSLVQNLKVEKSLGKKFFFSERLSALLRQLNSNLASENILLALNRKNSSNRKDKKTPSVEFLERIYETIRGELNVKNVKTYLNQLTLEIKESSTSGSLGIYEERLNLEGQLPEIRIDEEAVSINCKKPLKWSSMGSKISAFKNQTNTSKTS